MGASPSAPKEPIEGPALTIPEAAAALGVSTDTVRRRIRHGDLSATKDGKGRLRVRLAPGQGSGPGAFLSAETALLRDRVSLLERERETLVTELAARRRQSEADARERGEFLRLLAQAMKGSRDTEPA